MIKVKCFGPFNILGVVEDDCNKWLEDKKYPVQDIQLVAVPQGSDGTSYILKVLYIENSKSTTICTGTQGV